MKPVPQYLDLEKTSHSRQGAFALMVALSLMSFLLLLLLSLSSLIRVELGSSSSRSNRLLAEENAKLALQIAIGNLQRYTGVDQVSTAKADIFLSDAGNEEQIKRPHWLGVWDTAPVWDTDEEPYPRAGGEQTYERQAGWDSFTKATKLDLARTWLVSTDERERVSPTAEYSVGEEAKMASLPANLSGAAGGSDDAIYAPKVTISIDQNPNRQDSYSWWVSDESQKAKINIEDPLYGESDFQSQSIRSTLALRNGPEVPLGLFGSDIADWASVQSVDSIDILNGGGANNLSAAGYFHDFTVHGFGLLTSPTKGGLKDDLSLAFDIPDRSLYLRRHDSRRRDVFNYMALPNDRRDPGNESWMYSRLVDGGEYNVRNYIDVIESVSFEDVSNRPTSQTDIYGNILAAQGRDISLARWSLLGYHHNLYRYMDAPTSSSPSILSQPAHIAESYAQRRGWTSRIRRGVMAGMNFDGEGRRLNAVGGNPRPQSYNHLTRYKGMLFRPDSKSKLDLGAAEGPTHFPEEEDFITYPLAPLVSELILSVQVEYTLDGRVLLKYYPLLELTNPYDVSIEPSKGMLLQLMGNQNFIDFRLEPSATYAGKVPENVWSKPVALLSTPSSFTNLYSGGVHGTVDSGRVLRVRTSGNIRYVDTVSSSGSRRSPSTNAVDYPIFIPRTGLGVFEPGEVKTFVHNSGAGAIHTMAQGGSTTYDLNGLEKELRSFATGTRTSPNIEFKGLWPTHPQAYDSLEVETAISTLMPSGSTGFNRDVHIVASLSNYTTSEVDEPIDIVRASVSGDASASAANVKRWTLNRGSTKTIYTMHFERRSFDQYEDLGADGSIQGEDFLGYINPRSLLSDHEHGVFSVNFPNEIKHGPLNAEFRFNNDGSNPDLTGFGNWGADSATNSGAIFFHVPRRPPMSIAEYRHANLGFFGHEPAYVIGSSLPPIPHRFGNYDLTRVYDDWKNDWSDFPYNRDYSSTLSFGSLTTLNSARSRPVAVNLFPDLSYLYNAKLWDEYFLSSLDKHYEDTIADALNGEDLPNSRIQLRDSNPDQAVNLEDFQTSAVELLVDGSFNVNSTSVKAWAALLGSMRSIEPIGSFSTFDNLFLRMPTLEEDSSEWEGFQSIPDIRIYNESEAGYPISEEETLDSLAANIVQQVKARGPFLSLSHFINRQLSNEEKGESGALHKAIEKSDVNSGKQPYAPGSLMQGDLLSALGPVLDTRSDTFLIRARGESGVGGKSSEVWCEAVIQRNIEYMDAAADSPILAPDEIVSPLNQDFGRRFTIVSFRWLEESEI